MKCLIVVNPNSGRGRILKKLNLIKSRLCTKFDAVDIMYSKAKGHIKEIVELNVKNYHTIIICGGDGSIHEAVNGYVSVKSDCTLGFIPCGTINDFARNLGFCRDVNKCLDIILDENVEYVDLINNNGITGAYVCTFGTFTSCSYATSQRDKKFAGAVAYVFYAIRDLFFAKNKIVKIEVNGQTIQKNVSLALVFNSRTIGGLNIDKRADLKDGKLELVVFCDKPNKKRISLSSFFRIFKVFLCGKDKINPSENIISESISSVKIYAEEKLDVNMDGEIVDVKDINVSILPKRLKVYAKTTEK